MNKAAGIILTTGAITLANEALTAPYTYSKTDSLAAINWRVVPATAVAALLFTGLSTVNPEIATALAGLALVAVLFTRLGNSYSPIEHLAVLMGYESAASVPGVPPLQPSL
jgi:hypothetical protein